MKQFPFVAVFVYVLATIVCNGFDKQIELFLSAEQYANVQKTNIIVTSFTPHATSADEGAYTCNFEWIMEYNPRQLFRAVTETNNNAYGYTYFDRSRDYSQFTNWVIKDDQGTIVGRGTGIIPNPPEKMLHIIFTNIVMLIDYSYRDYTLECSVSQEISDDMLHGILSEDRITIYPNVPKLSLVHENGESVTILKPYPAPVTTRLLRASNMRHEKVTSIQRVGDDYLITTQINPKAGRTLEMVTNIGQTYRSASDSYVAAPAGEAHFLIPKNSATNEIGFYRMRVEAYDPKRTALIEAHIVLPGQGVDRAQYISRIDAGTITITAIIVTSYSSNAEFPRGDITYTWLTDTGESMRTIKSPQLFRPTFNSGVHWVKLYVTGKNIDAAFFSWVLVK